MTKITHVAHSAAVAVALSALSLLALHATTAAAQTPTYCVPTTATASAATAATFTPFATNERLEIRSGRINAADWEWGLGTNTQSAGAFQNINNINWASGVLIKFALTYDTAGNGVITLFDSTTNAQLATKAFAAPVSPATGLRAGNAIRLWVKTSAGSGIGAKVSASLNEVNGQVLTTPVSLETAGDNTYNEQAVVIALSTPTGPTTANTLTVKGQVTLSWPGAASAIPTGSRLNATINAGTVTCTTNTPQSQTITFAPTTPISYQPAPNNTITLNGTTTSGLPITFASTTPTVCATSGTNGNTATVLTAGTCTLTADQAGNDTVNAAVQVTASITVNQATQTITGFNPPATISQAAGSTLTLFATGGASGNPVLFASTTLSICTTAGTNGQTLTIAADGVCALTANQAGNTNYRAAAQQTASITINVPAQLYFIHADHLGTPRTITNAIDNTKVWEWKNDDAFGNNPPDENPANANAQPFKYHLRFPGQYFDQETGTYYNYFRDYDPSLGRYVQSDPIGLMGGINTYIYVLSNPISNFDPDGLKTLRDALSGAIKDKGLDKIPGMGKDIGGKAFEDFLGEALGSILCQQGAQPGDAASCLWRCTEFIVPVRDRLLDAAAPSGVVARGLMLRGIDNEAGGLIDGCTKSCTDKLQDFDREKRKQRK